MSRFHQLIREEAWYACDLDGTLAESDGSTDTIGEPLKPMVDFVRAKLAEGKRVKIFTARVWAPPWPVGGLGSVDSKLASAIRDQHERVTEQREMIETWCAEVLGQVLPITCEKNLDMIESWDDRARQVVANVGVFHRDLQVALEDLHNTEAIRLFDERHGIEGDAGAAFEPERLSGIPLESQCCVGVSHIAGAPPVFHVTPREGRCLAASVLRECAAADARIAALSKK